MEAFFQYLVTELDVRDRLRVKAPVAYDTDPLKGAVADARKLLKNLERSLPEEMEEFSAEAENIAKFLDSLVDGARSFVTHDRPDDIYIVERTARDVTVRIVPLTVGPLFEQNILERFRSVVFTSATLSVGGSFEHFRSVISEGKRDIRSVIAPPVFDFRSKVRLYVPRWKAEGHADPDVLTAEICRLARLTDGGTFVLFTNTKVLNGTYEILSKALELPVLRQGQGVSNYRLIEEFKSAGNAVLLGNMTFWQGVDIAGGRLRSVIITHLPFRVPTDPVIEARGEHFQRLNGNSFSSYYLPKAVLLLKQGFGRLVRGKDDSGFVAILDTRVMTRSYGRVFLDSLPDVPVLHDLGKLADFLRSAN
jgi:ATP-dependent DNA helicase DinG